MATDGWLHPPLEGLGVASAARHRWRVAKKLLPGQPGTVKLARQHGPNLVCVRYRVDAQTEQRYTTVELIVECAPMVRRPDRIVGVRVRFEETALQTQVKEHGAKWDKPAKLWRMPHRAALKLGLQDRIVQR